MKSTQKNFAYIDGANLHKGMATLGWAMDYKKFRVWLSEKYGVTTAYIFIGNIPKNSSLYSMLQEAGFILEFKEVVYDKVGKAKGNCDADLVLKMTQDFFYKKFDMAVLVSSDGDYTGTVSFLVSQNAFRCLLSPATEQKCSILLKRTNCKITYLNGSREKLEYTK